MDVLHLNAIDDMHCHLRDGAALTRTVADAARQCGRALVMPNLLPAVDTLDALEAYRERILTARPAGSDFEPLMTLYLSASMNPDTVRRARAAGVVAVKWYPKGATTNSAQGVADREALYPILAEMEKAGLLLLIHGEVTDAAVDIFERETRFLEQTLGLIQRDFPGLKIVLEHITTAEAVDYVRAGGEHLAATITAHHLLATRNDLLVGGIKPHFYCLPILKTERDRQALLAAATGGEKRFFLGSDSAPHSRENKEQACGCAGAYTMPQLLELYAAAFEEAGKLERLPDFAGRFGAEYYGLAPNARRITLRRQSQDIPEALPFGDSVVIPFWAGRSLAWTLDAAS